MAYPWIYLVADEWGRFEYRPSMIHGQVFKPRKDYAPDDTPTVADVAAWLQEYERAGLLVRYHMEGELAYWTNFYGRAIKDRHASDYPDPEAFTSGRGGFAPEPRPVLNEEDAPRKSVTAKSSKVVAIEQELEQEQEPPLPPAGAGDSDSVRQVFTCWQSVMGHSDAKLTPKRRRLIVARLREGYTVAQLCDAVAGCKASTFHMGQNDTGTVYDDLTLICRSGEKVESFLSKLKNGTALAVVGGRQKPAQGERTMDAIKRFAG